jgi:peptidoglycan/LPS O-acetylase OafA/YrhL
MSVAAAAGSTSGRIAYLDGHRGVAILMVALFHAYVRWPDIVPYGSRYSDFALFRYGWLGVDLFFMISGFVILMTLEKCATARIFLYRRWLRLFPGMLLCALLIFLTAGYFHERPLGNAPALSLLPALTFIEPAWWSHVVRMEIKPLEGAFWSLFVEFKFYVFAALLFFWGGRHALIAALLAAFALAIGIEWLDDYTESAYVSLAYEVVDQLSFRYCAWFAAGAAFYVYSRTASKAWFAGATAIAIASCIGSWGLQGATVAAIVVSLLFAASTASAAIQAVLRNRVLQFFGFVSYPLYLLHQNIMIAMVAKMGIASFTVPMYLYPLLALAMIAFTAWIVAKYGEPFVRNVLTSPMRAVRARKEA